jgi:hypothetical protein
MPHQNSHAQHINLPPNSVLLWQKTPAQTIQDRSRESCGFREPRMQMPELISLMGSGNFIVPGFRNTATNCTHPRFPRKILPETSCTAC